MASEHLGQHAIAVIGGYQLQAGASPQEFGLYLKTLEAAGLGTKTLWAHLVRQVYNKLVVTGSFCSIGIVLWALSQLGYNRTQIVKALKEQAYKLGLVTILRALCCGVTAFLLKSKYDNVWATQAQRSLGLSSTQDVEAAEEPRGISWTSWKGSKETTGQGRDAF